MGASWRTSLCGGLGLLAAGINLVAVPLLDGNPATGADLAGFLPLVLAFVALFFARDNKVSSEDAGAK